MKKKTEVMVHLQNENLFRWCDIEIISLTRFTCLYNL